jgi:hypothetical protein
MKNLLSQSKIQLQKILSLIDLIFQSNIGLKKSSKNEECHTRGGQKSAKKCHVLFEWPLTRDNVKKHFNFV